MPCSSSSRVTKKAAFSMQSRERLLTPLLKYSALALAHGILGNSSEKDDSSLRMQCVDGPCDLSAAGLSHWPVSSSQGPKFGLSFGRRGRVVKDSLNLEFNLPRGEESACLVHPETKVTTSVVYRHIVTVLPMLYRVFTHKKSGRKSVNVFCESEITLDLH